MLVTSNGCGGDARFVFRFPVAFKKRFTIDAAETRFATDIRKRQPVITQLLPVSVFRTGRRPAAER